MRTTQAVLVLAPSDYWTFWDPWRDKRPWRAAITAATATINEATELSIQFGSFDSSRVEPEMHVTDPLR